MADDWMRLSLNVPDAVGTTVLYWMRAHFNFVDSDEDPCEMTRPDGATVSFGPACDPVTAMQRAIRNLERVPRRMLTPHAQQLLDDLKKRAAEPRLSFLPVSDLPPESENEPPA
jgi:hypothetical protein